MTRDNDRERHYEPGDKKADDSVTADYDIEALPLYGPGEGPDLILFEVDDDGTILPGDAKDNSDAWIQSDHWEAVEQ